MRWTTWTYDPECAGDSSMGWGEYPSETAYSYCQKCVNEFKKND